MAGHMRQWENVTFEKHQNTRKRYPTQNYSNQYDRRNLNHDSQFPLHFTYLSFFSKVMAVAAISIFEESYDRC